MPLVTPTDLKARVRPELFYYDGDTAMTDARLQLHLDRAIAMLSTALASRAGPPLVAPLPEDVIGGICGGATYYALIDRGFTPDNPQMSAFRLQWEDYRDWCDKIASGLMHPQGQPTNSSPEVSSNERGSTISIGGGVGRVWTGGNRGY